MLSEYTKKQLQDELSCREEREKVKPKQIEKPDDTDLRKICDEYLDEQLKHREDTDTRHYIFEVALAMVYGQDIWKWIQKVNG
jgi:hypothetical protein